MLACVTFSMLP